jgi:alkyldihydroxyacetonephosphate synthase
MSIEINPSRIEEAALKELRRIMGPANVSVADVDRMAYGRDMWPRTLLWLSEGKVNYVPDCIAWPERTGQILEIFSLAKKLGMPVIPFGAGSGVCGGAVPLRGGISIDMKKMNAVREIDDGSMVAEIEAGIIGQQLEVQLNNRGYSMGHFPSSIYCSTLGGYLATRSAGQMSSRYGKIEDMVVSLEAALPRGEVVISPVAPCRGGFPDINQLLMGSEGTFGIITRAWMKIHNLPQSRAYRGFKFPDVESGLSAMREIMQLGLAPAVLRLYDEFDSMVFKSGEEGESSPAALFREVPGREKAFGKIMRGARKGSLGQLLRHPSLVNRISGILPGGCLLIMIFEGEEERCRLEHKIASGICRDYKGADMGEAPGKSWMAHRYSVSYKQSAIFDAGAFVDTMEVAAPWSIVSALYRRVCKAVSSKVFIMAHFSHAYPDGCCIYFSFAGAAATPEKMDNLYRRTWTAALETVHENGGTISHHHGVGMHKAAYMKKEHGEFMPYFAKLKDACDPDRIINPGKLGL